MKNNYIVAILLILLGAVSRLFPHPANFAPIAAIALFGGLYLPRKFAIVIPLFALFISDLVIGFYDWKIMLIVYASFALSGFIGLKVREVKNFSTILLATTLGAIIFYLTTNTAVWLFGTMYPHTASGLMQSFVLAIPFFKNSLLGDLFYTGILVGAMEIMQFYTLRRSYPQPKIS